MLISIPNFICNEENEDKYKYNIVKYIIIVLMIILIVLL